MSLIHPNYPTAQDIDLWCDQLFNRALQTKLEVSITDNHGYEPALGRFNAADVNRYIEFTEEDGQKFYAYWQPTFSKKAPLAVHIPGYGAEFHEHPELVSQGFNVLHVEPMGYCTPEGRQEHLKNGNDSWPVLPDTVSSKGEKGYTIWLKQVIMATQWAIKHFDLDQRVSFFGTSQGGAGALLLTSIYKDKGVQTVCADVPFLTNFPLANFRGAYEKVKQGIAGETPNAEEWYTIGHFDTMSHAHRLVVPVLLTAGEIDYTTPPETIKSLFEILPSTRSYTELKGVGHRYTKEFIPLTTAWFRLHA